MKGIIIAYISFHPTKAIILIVTKKGYRIMSLPKQINLRQRQVLKAITDGTRPMLVPVLTEEYTTQISHDTSLVTRVGEVLSSGRVQSRMSVIFDQLGLNETTIAQKLKDKTEATKTIYFQKDGIVTDSREVEAHDIQLKTLELITELRGMKVSRTANLNMNMDSKDFSNLPKQELDRMLREIDDKVNALEKRVG
jgi:hypothetical protein